jgi:hypothetical protein
VFAIAQISRLLFSNTSIPILASCPEILEVLQDLGRITIVCIKLKIENSNDSWFLDAADDILFMWASLISKMEYKSRQEIQQFLAVPSINSFMSWITQITSEVVKTYIEMRVLFDPSEEDDEDFNQKDIDNFSDQLLNISILARLKADEVILKLISILREKGHQITTMSSSTQPEHVERMKKLQEQTHWAVLIAGHIIADGAFGETPIIPASMLQLSKETPGGSDPVVMIATTIFGILDSLSSFPSNSVEHSNCSPLLLETLLWFCDRWSSSYLFPNINEYSDLSVSLQQSFSIQGGGAQILGFLLTKCHQQSMLWYSDIDVVQSLVKLLQGLSKNRTARDAMIEMSRDYRIYFRYFF